MKFVLKSSLAAAAVLALSTVSFAAQPVGAGSDPNTTVQHSNPTLTPAATNCLTDGTAAGGMTPHNNSASAAPAPAPGSNLMASDAGASGNAAGSMGSHNASGGGAVGNGLSAGTMASPAGSAHTDVSYNLNKCTGAASGAPATTSH